MNRTRIERMNCPRCCRPLRLARDGWKRCGSCGAAVMGLSLRTALRLATDGEALDEMQQPQRQPEMSDKHRQGARRA